MGMQEDFPQSNQRSLLQEVQLPIEVYSGFNDTYFTKKLVKQDRIDLSRKVVK